MQPQNERLQFGPYILDPAARQLFHNGVPVHLAPKSCDLLQLLLLNSGRVLEKEEILAAVWPDVTVEEGNLTQHISLLRKLLGTPPDGGLYIETVPKTGYRFLVPVSQLPQPPPPVRRSRGVLLLLAFLISAAAFYWLGRADSPSSLHIVWIVPISGGALANQIQAALFDEATRFPGYRVVLDAQPRPQLRDILCRARLVESESTVSLEFELSSPADPRSRCRYSGPADPLLASAAFHDCLHNQPFNPLLRNP